ncbi:hypothetical protein TC41_2424 [Alicyclobacillus acidocaldarius subsp. acidocaldarius Tc-4-1]|uniref:Uncharacterized protein n=1 Tax=Alicyclobacillus acidocaldarius (strain Tc-4-1) TaxID=1048834 RepID=F8IGP4_ALIAT|nr:hypothetical protein TC41_2424 [Alicyclobacillus acidocaldarius subsp. acidocaldarius Tc-4-1]
MNLSTARRNCGRKKTALLVDLLTTFQERLSDEAVERLVTAVADVLRDEKG